MSKVYCIMLLLYTYLYLYLFVPSGAYRRTVSSVIRSGPVLQLLPPRMTCLGRCRSREMVCFQVVCGLPWPLLPGSFQFIPCFGSLSVFMRVSCAYQVRRLFWSMMLRGHWPIFSLTLEVRTLSCHLILRMRRRFLESKLSIRFSIVLVTAYV